MSHKFIVQLNGGEQHELVTETGLYGLACAAAVALFPHDPLEGDDKIIYPGYHGMAYPLHEECVLVKIWNPLLIIPDSRGRSHGPYYYGVTNSGHAVSMGVDEVPERLR